MRINSITSSPLYPVSLFYLHIFDIHLQVVRKELPDSKVRICFWALNVIANIIITTAGLMDLIATLLGSCVPSEVYTCTVHKDSLSISIGNYRESYKNL